MGLRQLRVFFPPEQTDCLAGAAMAMEIEKRGETVAALYAIAALADKPTWHGFNAYLTASGN